MLATVLVKGRAQRVPTVPEQAVVRGENKDFLFLQTGPDAFVLREVQLGPEAGGLRRVLSGARVGERIVTEGAFLLDVERQRQQTQ
jgi:cobalt-zinc-cadmium efflux system membrane fusion protein